MIGGGRDGGVGGGWCGLCGIAFGDFSMGVPELGTGQCSQASDPLQGAKEISRERAVERWRVDPCLGEENLFALALLAPWLPPKPGHNKNPTKKGEDG